MVGRNYIQLIIYIRVDSAVQWSITVSRSMGDNR
jgi:hypothetical protein